MFILDYISMVVVIQQTERLLARHLVAPSCQVPCHIFLPVVPAARVIGKGGASIKVRFKGTAAGKRKG